MCFISKSIKSKNIYVLMHLSIARDRNSRDANQRELSIVTFFDTRSKDIHDHKVSYQEI
jgi:hypothetical protein